LRVKWTLAAVGIAVVPTAVLGIVVLDIQRAGLSRAEKELEAAVVDEAAASILGMLDQADDVAARVTTVMTDERVDVDARMRIIGDVVARAPAISGAAFFDEEGRFVDAVVPKDAPLDDALRVSPEARTTGAFRVLTLGEARVARYEAPLRERGAIVVGLSRDVFGDKLREISLTRFGAPDRVVLVDDAFHVLGGGGARPPALLASAAASGLSFATPLIVTTELDDGRVHAVGTIRTMPSQRWALVVERPADEAFAALASARRAFVASVVGLVGLAIVAGAIVARRSLGPIASLMELVRRYAQRDFRARSAVTSGDELEALGTSLERMADDLAASERTIEERARVEANLRRYLPAEAAEVAAGEPGTLELGGVRKRVTVVFADVVAFTGFAESASPERAVAFLNELFTILSEIVFRHGGMVDKFIGDCIMAVFDSSRAGEDVARALAAAEDMHAFVDSNLPRWREAYAFRVELGIGIATGDVLMGNLGSSSRMEYTVIGDPVNVAARLEALARPRQTLTTKDVVEACPSVSFASLGEHALRGRAKMVEVFEVVA
jgi:class 3 adenylate cyclase